ncbi:MAG: hypothetical protein JWP75_1322 [Frondihabitans sp.]|nr:hypothetical protein [Frondihabitans sp.]
MTSDTGRDETGVGTRDDDDEDDDEALRWGASSDKSYVEGPAVPQTAVAEDDDEDDDELPPGVMSSGMLVVHGVFAAIMILSVVAWLKSIGSVQPSFGSPIADWMWRIGTWFAVAAPALWFAGTIVLIPTAESRRRVLAFLVGVVILLPWPFLIGAFA